MKCEYRQLGTLVERKIGYGIVQPGSSQKQGTPIIKVNNIISGLKNIADLECTTEQISSKYQRTKLRGGELIISVVGTIGKTAIVPKSFAGCNLVRATAMIDIPDLELAKWVKYYIDSPNGQAYIHQNLNTTVQPTLNIKSLYEMPIPFYSDNQMQQIIAVLESLDDKIILNNKINANLQQQAQAIFKSWFVDFEPFQDGEFVESELGPIPKGWRVGRLADVCSYGKEKITVSELTPENYFSTENMLANKGGYTSAASLPNVLQTTRCVPGDTLISNIRPYFKKIVYCMINAGCSTDVLCLRPKHPKYSTYLYNLAYSDAFFDYMVAGSKGTKMPRGDKQQIMGYPVILPPDEVIEKFHEFADTVLKKIRTELEENKKLTVLRDSLLPKLMNGEIEIDGI